MISLLLWSSSCSCYSSVSSLVRPSSVFVLSTLFFLRPPQLLRIQPALEYAAVLLQIVCGIAPRAILLAGGANRFGLTPSRTQVAC